MILYGLNKILKHARQRGFILNQTNKLTLKIFRFLCNIKIGYYLKFRIPMCHRQFFNKFFQNPDYVERFCNDLINPFHFTCRKKMIEQ